MLRLFSRLGYAVQLVQVRLRFVLIVGAIFGLVACWPRLAHYWDRMMVWTTGVSAGERGISSDTEYFCPMCPGVLSAWPEKCPVCKMPLVRRKRGEAALLPEGVVARMQISPYRVQLGGIKTTQVAYLPLLREVRLIGKVSEGESAKERLIEADLSPLDLPLVAVHQSAELTMPAAIASQPNSGKVVALEPKSAAKDAYILRLQASESAPAIPAGTEVSILLRTAAAELEPLRSQPRNPPPLDKESPRAVFLCTDHPSYLHHQAGKCPFDENELHEHPLLTNQRLEWFCPLHPKTHHAAGHECDQCKKGKLPRIVTYAPAGQVLAVPESAVIDNGVAQFVFVESMPGMFDAIPVKLASPVNGYYPVVAGLSPGQKVASSGAFLLDAETRLNPSLAASYFGAGGRDGQNATATQVSSSLASSDLLTELKLSPRQLVLARAQKICPITRQPLGSMGELVEIEVDGREVYLCCEGCRSRVKVASQPAGKAQPAVSP